MTVLLGAWVLGILLGFRHAFEPDHLSAVAMLVTERNDRRAGLWVGAIWGLGHTLALLLVAGALAAIQSEMPASLESAFELIVAAMLCVLGARAILQAFREGRSGPVLQHEHGRHRHSHSGIEGHFHVGRWVLSPKPLLIGLIHGLAGSGAMTAVAMAAMPTTASRVAYVALFGFGSICGMALLTGLLGLPLQRIQSQPAARWVLSGGAGVLALGIGCWWGFSHLTSAG